MALEITLRLLPKPETFRTVLAAYDSLEKAGDAVAQVVASGLLPGAMEIMDRLAIQAAEAAVHAGYPLDAAALLIVELDGEAEQVEEEWRQLEPMIEASGAYQVRVAQDEADRLRIWKGRKSAFSAVGRLSPDYLVNDGVVPRGKLGEALVEIERLSAAYDMRVANVFHAGDGNLHPLILYNGREAGAYERAEQLAGEILRSLHQLRRLHHRRARHRRGEARLPAGDVQRARHGHDVPRAPRRRSDGDLEPRQGVPLRRGAHPQVLRPAPAGAGRGDLARVTSKRHLDEETNYHVRHSETLSDTGRVSGAGAAGADQERIPQRRGVRDGGRELRAYHDRDPICIVALATQLKRRSCTAYGSDLRVKVRPTGLYTYPDIVVICGQPQFEDRQQDTL